MKFGVAAAVAIGLAAVFLASHPAAPAPDAPVVRAVSLTQTAPMTPEAALGGGIGGWLAKHSGDVAEVLQCAVTGGGLASVLVGTITGYGAVALVVAGLVCVL